MALWNRTTESDCGIREILSDSVDFPGMVLRDHLKAAAKAVLWHRKTCLAAAGILSIELG